MILLDTHIWIWWINNDTRLTTDYRDILAAERGGRLAISAITLWEVAKLTEKGRLVLDRPVGQWMRDAVALPDVELLPLTWEIALLSTQLPGHFHNDPADQIIVATAMQHGISLLTEDSKILAYAQDGHLRCIVRSSDAASDAAPDAAPDAASDGE